MIPIFLKELNTFFSSLIGYIVIGVFLVLMGLIMWVFPDYSVLNYNYATLEQLFELAPVIFLFLIPAITMRSFAEEMQSGTIELLATRPVRDWEIVLGKYLAALTLVAFSILPTLLYLYTIYQLGAPPGNIDTGAAAGSYLGLLLLGAVFVAIGLFSSSLTDNQIIAFILGMFLCFVFYWAFLLLSKLPIFVGKVDDLVQMAGVDYHYQSISRGVVDTRDLVYFLSIIAIFVFLTQLSITRRNWMARRKWQVLLQALLFLGIAVFANILGNAIYTNFDLTEEKRYTLTDATREVVRNVDDVVDVRILLEGEFPAGFKRLQRSVVELLEEFQSESGYIEYSFDDPSAGTVDEVNQRRESLAKDGIMPVNLRLKGTGETTEKLIYPYAIFYYKGRQAAVNFLEKEVIGLSDEEVLNNSISLLEYKFANAIQKLRARFKPQILFTYGKGELTDLQTKDLEVSLRSYYDVGRINLDSLIEIPADRVDLVVIPRPRGRFSTRNKFVLDQYIMRGGKTIWLLDKLNVHLDSLRGRPFYVPLEYELNLEDLLFRYGVKINSNFVLDLEASRIPQVIGTSGTQPQIDYFTWYYHPAVSPKTDHPIVKGIDRVNLFFPHSIDTVNTGPGIRKTILLQSSKYSREQFFPMRLNFEILRYDPVPEKFNKPFLPMAVLLEGKFTSLYQNRIPQEMAAGLRQLNMDFKGESEPTRMLVVADGDIAKNPVNPAEEAYLPLGFNRYDNYTYGNKDFLINAIEYLLDDKGLAEARAKEVKLRLLDTVKAQKERTQWQAINILLPLAFLGLFGLGYNFLRRRRYGL